MSKLILILLFQTVFLIKNIKRKGGWRNASTILLLMYFATALLSIPNVLINNESSISRYSLLDGNEYWLGVIAYIFFIFIFLFPLYYFKENKNLTIKLPNIGLLNIFSSVLIVLSIFSIAFYLPAVIKMFKSGTALAILRNNLSSIRTEYVNTEGLWNTIASVSSSLYPFAMMLFFLYYIKGKNTIRCALLFVSSTSKIIMVLSFVGRDGVVFWIINFIFMYFLFYNYFSEKQKKRLRSVFIVMAAVAMIPILAISISRFGGKSNNGTMRSILSYLGQMVPNYLLFFNVRADHYCFGSAFPLLYEIIGKEKPTVYRWIDGGTESNVFGTFLKSFNISLGVWGTVAVGIFALIVFCVIFGKEKKVLSYHYYFVYILYFHTLSEGLFYFKDYTRGGNLFIIICVVLFFAFRALENKFGCFVLEKHKD